MHRATRYPNGPNKNFIVKCKIKTLMTTQTQEDPQENKQRKTKTQNYKKSTFWRIYQLRIWRWDIWKIQTILWKNCVYLLLFLMLKALLQSVTAVKMDRQINRTQRIFKIHLPQARYLKLHTNKLSSLDNRLHVKSLKQRQTFNLAPKGN